MRRRTCISFFVLSVLSAALCISSCDRMELMPQRPQSDEGKTVTLRVIVPEPVVVDPMTRAGAGDFDKIRDLNIVAADGGSDDSALFEVYYADGSQNGDPAVEMEEGKDITIHFSEEFTGRYGLTRKKFYIVANYGRKIDKAAVTTVGLLKALKQESSEGFPGIPVNGCMMFAEAGHAGTHTHPDTGQTGLSLSAELRRTVAMITVGIDGSRLAAGVSIVPRRISLHRVPVQCYLGMANKPYEDETLGIEEIGEQKGDGGELNWPMVVGDATLSSDQGQAPSWAASAETYAGHASNVHLRAGWRVNGATCSRIGLLRPAPISKSRRCICAGIPMVQPDTGEPSGSASSWGTMSPGTSTCCATTIIRSPCSSKAMPSRKAARSMKTGI